MIKSGKPMLHVQEQKAMYDMLKSALLLYGTLRKELEDYGFTINPCIPYLANADKWAAHDCYCMWIISRYHIKIQWKQQKWLNTYQRYIGSYR